MELSLSNHTLKITTGRLFGQMLADFDARNAVGDILPDTGLREVKIRIEEAALDYGMYFIDRDDQFANCHKIEAIKSYRDRIAQHAVRRGVEHFPDWKCIAAIIDAAQKNDGRGPLLRALRLYTPLTVLRSVAASLPTDILCQYLSPDAEMPEEFSQNYP